MKEKLLTMAVCLFFLAGMGIFCYPYVMERYYEHHTSRVLGSYKEELQRPLLDHVSTSPSPTSQSQNGLYEEMRTYNETIYENNQKDLTDPFSYESADFDLTAYGLSENIIGYLTIPAMELELPVYLGANTENLAKGAVHLGQTSMPIGGVNTNVVLAAHRGYRGIPMFREIEKLKTGDLVTFTTPFDTLSYQVSSTEIILPEEIDKILIQPGQDMLTLLTCHPYRQNTHRYLVYCQRIEEAKEEAKEEPKQISDENTQSSAKKEEPASNPPASSSKWQIALDRYIPIAGILFLALLFTGCVIWYRKK